MKYKHLQRYPHINHVPFVLVVATIESEVPVGPAGESQRLGLHGGYLSGGHDDEIDAVIS